MITEGQSEVKNPFADRVDFHTAKYTPAELSTIKRDKEDFKEFEFELNNLNDGVFESMSSHNGLGAEFFDIQRLLTLEKGEDRYYQLHSKKNQSY